MDIPTIAENATVASIPDDVMKAAEAAFAGHGRAGEFEETRQIRDNIARAIMAERERNAEVAISIGRDLTMNESAKRFTELVANAIRRGEA